MTETKISISGMSCGHCVNRVKKAIDALNGISSSDVQIGTATISFDEAMIDRAAIAAAIENAGYKVTD
ncbi:MAG: cation transporter [Dissulfurispiraceae bacterium]|jgi:copper chaperone|nr:cation transporter [Dissulfurispiraceae bacterium]